MDGAFNMAADEVLAASAARDHHVILRLFEWDPWTLSLGKHQRIGGVDLDRCRQAKIQVVRRLTGGRAVLHARELTYSICVPVLRHSEKGEAPRVEADSDFSESCPRADGVGFHHDVALRVGQALCHGLRALGADVKWIPRGRGASYQRSASGVPQGVLTLRKSALCFASVARGEILWHGKKVVGSAQRVLDGVILQHGSILLGPGHEQIVDLFEDASGASSEILRSHTATLKDILGGIPEVPVVARKILEGFRNHFDTLDREETLTYDEEGEIRKRAYSYFLGGWEMVSPRDSVPYSQRGGSGAPGCAA